MYTQTDMPRERERTIFSLLYNKKGWFVFKIKKIFVLHTRNVRICAKDEQKNLYLMVEKEEKLVDLHEIHKLHIPLVL